MIRAKLDAFRDTVDANHNGAGVVIKDGYLVYKWGSDTAVIDWASAAKPCIATMLFAAVNEGKVASEESANKNLDKNLDKPPPGPLDSGPAGICFRLPSWGRTVHVSANRPHKFVCAKTRVSSNS